MGGISGFQAIYANRVISTTMTCSIKQEYMVSTHTLLNCLNVQDSIAEVDSTRSQYSLVPVSLILDLILKLVNLDGVMPLISMLVYFGEGARE